MVNVKCPECNGFFEFVKDRKKHHEVMCPWCGVMIDIGTGTTKKKMVKM